MILIKNKHFVQVYVTCNKYNYKKFIYTSYYLLALQWFLFNLLID